MMVETFQVPNGILIIGARATGKTVLELNLRNSILGRPDTSEDYATVQLPGQSICFIGRTVAKKGKANKILATAGSELLDGLVGIPKASWYIASMTPGYDKAGVMEFYKLLEEVYVISLFSKKRGEYYTKRTLHYSGNMPSKPLGPAREVEVPEKIGKRLTLVLPHSTEQAVNAYGYILATLGIEGKDFDADIYSRPIL